MQLTSEKISDSCFDNWPCAMKIGLLTNRNEGISYKAGRIYNIVVDPSSECFYTGSTKKKKNETCSTGRQKVEDLKRR